MKLSTLIWLAVLIAVSVFAGREYKDAKASREEIAQQNRTVTQQNEKIQALTQTVARLQTPPVAKPQVVAKATTNPAFTRVVCAACKGEGHVVYSPLGAENPLDRKSQPCPLCGSKGYRDTVVAQGRKLCPECQGMGVIYASDPGGRIARTNNCPRCVASGTIVDIK